LELFCLEIAQELEAHPDTIKNRIKYYGINLTKEKK